MFFRLLANSLARRMSRKLLAAFAVWVGISLILAFLAVSIDVGDKMNRELQAGGREVTLLGVWFEHTIPVEGGEPFATGARRVYQHWRVQGAWPSEGSAGGEIPSLVGDSLARKLGGRRETWN